MDKRITTLDELIDLVAFGDIHEGTRYYLGQTEPTEYPAVQLPYYYEEPSKTPEFATIDETREEILILLIAFKEGRLSSGGHVLPKATPTTSEHTTP